MSEKQPGNIYNISGKQLANAAKIRDFRNRVLLAESAKEDRDYTDRIIGIIYSLCEQMLPAVEETVRVIESQGVHPADPDFTLFQTLLFPHIFHYGPGGGMYPACNFKGDDGMEYHIFVSVDPDPLTRDGLSRLLEEGETEGKANITVFRMSSEEEPNDLEFLDPEEGWKSAINSAGFSSEDEAAYAEELYSRATPLQQSVFDRGSAESDFLQAVMESYDSLSDLEYADLRRYYLPLILAAEEHPDNLFFESDGKNVFLYGDGSLFRVGCDHGEFVLQQYAERDEDSSAYSREVGRSFDTLFLYQLVNTGVKVLPLSLNKFACIDESETRTQMKVYCFDASRSEMTADETDALKEFCAWAGFKG